MLTELKNNNIKYVFCWKLFVKKFVIFHKYSNKYFFVIFLASYPSLISLIYFISERKKIKLFFCCWKNSRSFTFCLTEKYFLFLLVDTSRQVHGRIWIIFNGYFFLLFFALLFRTWWKIRMLYLKYCAYLINFLVIIFITYFPIVWIVVGDVNMTIQYLINLLWFFGGDFRIIFKATTRMGRAWIVRIKFKILFF